MRERVSGLQHPDTLMLIYNLANCLDEQGKIEEARPFAQRAAEGARKVLGPDHPDALQYEKLHERLTIIEASAPALYERSYEAFERAEYEQAERLALRSIDKAKQEQPLDNSQLLRALDIAGECALQRSNAVIALAHFTNAANFIDKLADPLEWAHNLSAQARALAADLQYAQAERLLRQVVAIRSEKLSPEHPDTLRRRGTLADVLVKQGKAAEAEAEYRALIQILQRVLGAEHAETVNSRVGLALVLQRRGKFAEAEAEHREVVQIAERVFGPEHPGTLTARFNLATCLQRPSRAKEASEYARRAMEGRRKVLGSDHPDTKLAEQLYKQLSTTK